MFFWSELVTQTHLLEPHVYQQSSQLILYHRVQRGNQEQQTQPRQQPEQLNPCNISIKEGEGLSNSSYLLSRIRICDNQDTAYLDPEARAATGSKQSDQASQTTARHSAGQHSHSVQPLTTHHKSLSSSNLACVDHNKDDRKKPGEALASTCVIVGVEIIHQEAEKSSDSKVKETSVKKVLVGSSIYDPYLDKLEDTEESNKTLETGNVFSMSQDNKTCIPSISRHGCISLQHYLTQQTDKGSHGDGGHIIQITGQSPFTAEVTDDSQAPPRDSPSSLPYSASLSLPQTSSHPSEQSQSATFRPKMGDVVATEPTNYSSSSPQRYDQETDQPQPLLLDQNETPHDHHQLCGEELLVEWKLWDYATCIPDISSCMYIHACGQQHLPIGSLWKDSSKMEGALKESGYLKVQVIKLNEARDTAYFALGQDERVSPGQDTTAAPDDNIPENQKGSRRETLHHGFTHQQYGWLLPIYVGGGSLWAEHNLPVDESRQVNTLERWWGT